MNKIKIADIDNELFAGVWALYEELFPLSERRTIEEQQKILGNPAYFLEAWTEDGHAVGFMGWWNCDDLRFVEHYAISADRHSKGYGSAFMKEWIAESEKPVILEIEMVTDETTARRKNFYLRLGFHTNDIEHFQPPFHPGIENIDMEVLSFPRPVTTDEYDRFRRKQLDEIMPKL